MKTKRLEIREYRESDRDEYIALVTNEVVMKFVDDGAVDAETAARWWERLRKGIPEGCYRRCIAETDTKEFVGHMMLNPYPLESGQYELGYVLKQNMWGRGYATEAVSALAQFARDDVGLKRVFATVDIGHVKSVRVLEKCRFQFYRYYFNDEGPYEAYLLEL